MNKKSKVDRYELYVHDFVCNKFGFAQYFISNYDKLCLNPKKVLDVGCGVGPFSIYFADKKANVDAIDINPIATNLCEKNSKLYNLNKFINIINEDFSKYHFKCKYDLIITNPPIDTNNRQIMNKTSALKVKSGHIDSKLFSFITNSWKDDKQIDLVENIFKISKYILSKDGVIALVFGDIESDNYAYVKSLVHKYDLNIINHIYNKIDASKIGLPPQYKYVLAHILILKY